MRSPADRAPRRTGLPEPAHGAPVPSSVPLLVWSPRLTVRCYRAGDGPRLHAAAVRNRAHLARYESGNILLTADTQERGESIARDLYARWLRREAFFAGAFLRATGAFAGQVYLGPSARSGEFEIGYMADVDQEGRGYVSEAVEAMLGLAFDCLGAQRVYLRTDPTNTRSRNVARRCGFSQEEHTSPDDAAVYRLTPEEYRRHR